MRQLFTDNPEKILAELNSLIEEQTPLTFCQDTADHQILTAESLQESDTNTYLFLTKTVSFNCKAGMSFVFYKRPGQLMRCFNVSHVKDFTDCLAIPLPAKIDEIQRRKLPRISAPSPSVATFTPKDKQRILTFRVVEISLEGARLQGAYTDILKNGAILSPLTLRLTLQYSDLEEEIQISVAKIVWLSGNEEGEMNIGVHFHNLDANQKDLDNYINIRKIELDAAGTKSIP